MNKIKRKIMNKKILNVVDQSINVYCLTKVLREVFENEYSDLTKYDFVNLMCFLLKQTETLRRNSFEMSSYWEFGK